MERRRNVVKKGRRRQWLSAMTAIAMVAAGLVLPAQAAPAAETAASENPRFVNSVEDESRWWCMPSFSTTEGTGLFEFDRNSEPVEANKTHATYQWVMEPVSGLDLYRIKCRNSGMYLTVQSPKERAQVVQTANPGNGALWEVNEVQDGQFSVINFQTGMAITRGTPGEYGEVEGDVYEVQTEYTGAKNQLWKFEYYSDKELRSIAIDDSISNGTISSNYKTTVSGEMVYLTVTPEEGYVLSAGSLKVDGEPLEGTRFVMPDRDVEVTAEFVSATDIERISVKEQPQKTEYAINEALDLTGLVLEVEYEDGSRQEITSGYQVSGVDMSKPGTKEIEISYGGFQVTLEISVVTGPNYTTGGVIYSAPSYSKFDPARPSSRNSVLSPRGLQLKYQANEADNGKMLATWETSVVELLPERFGKFLPIYESTDYGENWNEVGRIVEDTEKQNWAGDWEIENCPHIFELPADVGEMKKGGIVAVMDVCPRDLSQTYMDMYYSGDMGRTWEYVSTIVDDGTRNYMGSDPVWEPFILYDPVTEALIVYYSDERDPRYGQKLVLQYTKDGTNWSEVIDVVAQTDTSMRPGMPIIAQMENGYYVMVFEGVGLNIDGIGGTDGLPCNYKISLYPNDPIHWDPADIGYTFAYGGNPYVVTLPDGHIAMNVGLESDIFINTQKDLTGEFIKYPTGVADGYNRQLIPVDDGTEKGSLLTLSCEYPDTGNPNSVKWGKLDLNTVTIPDTKATLYDISVSDETTENVNVWPKGGQVHAGEDQYFMIQAKRGNQISRVLVNGQEVTLHNSWIKVPTVNQDINLTVETQQVSEEARIINTKEDPQFYLVPPAYSTLDGREIFEWTLENNIHFYWTVEPDAATGAYRIKNMNTNMYLSVKGNAGTEGANIIQTQTRNNASLWKLTEVEDGWFSIINYNSGLAITRGELGAFEGPNERFAVQKEYTGADNQLWGLDYVLESRQLYSVDIDSQIRNGSVAANYKNAARGETVFVTVDPDEGYKLAGLEVNGQTITGNSFVMPEGNVTVTAQFVPESDLPQVEYIDVTPPDQQVYEIGEPLNLEGMVVTVHYSDGSDEQVMDYKIEGFSSDTAGEKKVTVSYTENGKTWEAEFSVTVNEEKTDDPGTDEKPGGSEGEDPSGGTEGEDPSGGTEGEEPSGGTEGEDPSGDVGNKPAGNNTQNQNGGNQNASPKTGDFRTVTPEIVMIAGCLAVIGGVVIARKKKRI